MYAVQLNSMKESDEVTPGRKQIRHNHSHCGFFSEHDNHAAILHVDALGMRLPEIQYQKRHQLFTQRSYIEAARALLVIERQGNRGNDEGVVTQTRREKSGFAKYC